MTGFQSLVDALVFVAASFYNIKYIMRYTLYVGSYFGIPVRIHFTFPLILVAFGMEAWLRGSWQDAVNAVLLILAVFVCVVLHELGHSLQVRRYGIRVRDIILLPIGGMARAEKIPDKPWQEIVVAISGPIVNFVLAAFFLVLILWRNEPIDVQANFLTNLFAINLVLGSFNLIPAFPMDGGRILRGLLALKLPYLKATRYAKNVGQIIALGFVVIGFVSHSLIMLPVIAVFIFFGAMNEENMVRVKILLEGKTARDLVAPNQPSLRMNDPVESAVELITPTQRVFAVTDANNWLYGVVTSDDLLASIRAGRGSAPVAQITRADFPVFGPDTPAPQAYYFLKEQKKRFAGVVDGDVFVGLMFYDSLLG